MEVGDYWMAAVSGGVLSQGVEAVSKEKESTNTHSNIKRGHGGFHVVEWIRGLHLCYYVQYAL